MTLTLHSHHNVTRYSVANCTNTSFTATYCSPNLALAGNSGMRKLVPAGKKLCSTESIVASRPCGLTYAAHCVPAVIRAIFAGFQIGWVAGGSYSGPRIHVAGSIKPVLTGV